MSRSCLALAEIRRRGGLVHFAGERRRFDGRLRRGPRPLPSAVSATKYAAVLVAAMMVMAAEPAQALASSGRNAQAGRSRIPPTGHAGARKRLRRRDGGDEVRSLQRRLDREGYSAGAVDGRYGPRTENAVRRFQTARGLRVDGIAGPLTLAARALDGAVSRDGPRRRRVARSAGSRGSFAGTGSTRARSMVAMDR